MRKRAAILSVCVLCGLTQAGFAQSGLPDGLDFFKNYFVTGDYVVAGVGLRGQGDATGFATNYINISGVPDGADIVAAFLYWETIEKTATPSSMNGFFRGYAITGKPLGADHTAPCWSSGGGTGGSQGVPTIRVYRADVRPFLPVVNGKHQASGALQVRLPDSGSNGNGVPLTEGASLVVVYRVISPTFPLKAIVIYDGAWTMDNNTSFMSQTIKWFYQASAPRAGRNPAKLTHIVANGQSNFSEQLLFQGSVIALTPFVGAQGFSWDNPTFDVSTLVQDNASVVNTQVLPIGNHADCLSWGAVVFSTPVKNSDGDALLDVWKTNQGYQDPADGTMVALPGAKLGQRDLFIQIDYLVKANTNIHSHLPKQAALDTVGNAFLAQGIHVHFDVGNNYQSGDPFIVPYTGSGGGNIVDEDSLACQDSVSKLCQFPGQPGVVSWKGGLTFIKNFPLNYPDEASCEAGLLGPCIRRFQHGRKDSYHYVLFGHALGLPTFSWNTSSTIPGSTLVSIVNNGTTAVATTATPHGLTPGTRVAVSGAIEDFDLNAAYNVQTVPTPTTFTITTANVANGTYSLPNEPGLAVSSGLPKSTSGWSDLGGGDTMVTLGLWRSDNPADDQVGSAGIQGRTLLHELGHTIGLTHGGYSYSNAPANYWPTFGANCKANFQSVMNYLFQIRGLTLGLTTGIADFSSQVLGPLNEGSLSEQVGLGSPLALYSTTRWYGPLSPLDQQLQKNSQDGFVQRAATKHCDGSPLLPTDASMVRVEAASTGSIDWNNDGSITPALFAQDVDFNGSSSEPPFTGYDDWMNIDLRQMGARHNALGFSVGIWGSEDVIGGGSEDLIGGGSEDVIGGGSEDVIGGGSEDLIGGGAESDFEYANSTVDPPNQINAVQVGHNVVVTWTAPDFGQIRTYYIWRVVGSITPTNPPTNVGKVTGAPPATTFTDNSVHTKTTYTYFVTDALGNKVQSGASNMMNVMVIF